ncbi:hypothetical protein [Streptomyces sp.]|uniref:hypothetical protein n=1 Tax=Streptomyces sp. TaxID=1931 RepID=UPI002F91CAAA
MDREELLGLYQWGAGTCFRHPEKGTIATILVKTIHPRGEGEREIRACRDCVVGLEDIRREAAARAGSDYEPGHVGEGAM